MPDPKSVYVCADDPTNTVGVGAVVSLPKTAHALESKGAVLLPVTPRLMVDETLTLGGFTRREWGFDGWLFDLQRGEPGCSTALQVKAGNSMLYWAARLQPRANARAVGKLQLTAARVAPGSFSGGLRSELTPSPVNTDRSLIIRGSCRFSSQIDGFLALQLWGVCSATRVMWLAVSQVIDAGAS